MRVTVLGHLGTLGSRVRALAEASDRIETVLTAANADISDAHSLALIAGQKPDVIINCAGRIPQKSPSNAEMVRTNAEMPHLLSQILGEISPATRVIHMSTDCVFGRPEFLAAPRYHHISDTPIPDSFYGQTKLVGEVDSANWTNVRGSFIAPETGLWKWVIESAENNRSVDAWVNAWWNGTTADNMAAILVDMALEEGYSQVEHVSSSYGRRKYDIIAMIAEEAGYKEWVNTHLVIRNSPYIERLLGPTYPTPDIYNQLQEYYHA